MLTFKNNTLKQLCLQAQTEYPAECCGILLGKYKDEQKIACNVIQTENAVKNNQSTAHFQIDPLEIAKAELLAEQNKLEVIGFCHSHPNQKAVPSTEDERHIIAGYSYPIISVIHGECVDVRCYEKTRQTDTYVQEEIFIKEK